MSKQVHCHNCNLTYAPVGDAGKLYCRHCGGKVHHVLKETLTDGESPKGILVELQPQEEILVEVDTVILEKKTKKKLPDVVVESE